ncbi:MAG: sugar ABC transporter substrate-binding protein [Chloroflexi bacterium]|nr:sugar ABC transporter substrate-binding protein [Chloroflexota bacterium]
MLSKGSLKLAFLAVLVIVLIGLVAGCAAPTAAPPPPAATQPPAQPAATQPPAQPAATQPPAQPAATQPPAQAGVKTLKIITLTGPRYEMATTAMANAYNKAHSDVKIQVEAFPQEDQIAKVGMDVAAKGNAYDLIWIDYKFIGGYADAGYLLPMDDYLKANADWWKDLQGDVYPQVLNMYSYKDHWYGLPNDGNTELFYYRKDVLDAAGVKLPTTWDETLAAAQKLNNPPKMYGLCGNFARYWATDFWLSMFFSKGGVIWDPKTYEPGIDSAAGKYSADMMVKLLQYAPKEALQWEEGDVYSNMGSAGICAMAPAQWGGAVLTNPTLAKLADKIAVGRVPAIDAEGKQLILPMGGFGLGINAKTKYPDVAFDFIKYWLSRENQQYLVQNTGQPARNSALTDPVNLKIAPYFAAESENLKFAVPRPVVAEYASAEQIIGNELDNVFLGKKTTDQALKDANSQVRDVLVKSGKLVAK